MNHGQMLSQSAMMTRAEKSSQRRPSWCSAPEKATKKKGNGLEWR